VSAPRYSFRAATPDDEDFLFELHRLAMGPVITELWGWDEQLQREFHQKWFGRPRLDPMRIVVTQKPVGVLDVERRPDEVYLARIELLPAWQGRGLGGAIVQEVLDGSSRLGLPVTLHVFETNRARGLYERLGFRELSREGNRLLMEAVPG
jgi:ribosomal protein S18 acetylase RimI-like enzyme